MIDREAADEARIGDIGIEVDQVLGEEHALVDDRAAGERADVELADLGFDDRVLDATADDVEVALEDFVGAAKRVADDDLLDLGTGRVGLFADHGRVDRDLTPAIDGIAEFEDLGLDDLPAAFLGGVIGLGQEDLAHRDAAALGGVAETRDLVSEELLRDLEMDAGTVAGLAVGIDRAAMPDRLECGNAGFYDLAPRRAINRGDETDAARIVFVRRVVDPFEPCCVVLPGCDERLGAFDAVRC